MKQKFTFLVLMFCLFAGFSGKIFAQILLMEGFEESSFPPANTPYGTWTLAGTGTNFYCSSITNWEQVASGGTFCFYAFGPTTNPIVNAHGGSFDAGYNSFRISSGGVGVLITPPINFPSAASTTTQYVLTFWMYGSNNTGGNTATLTVVLAQNNSYPFTPLAPPNTFTPVGPTATTGWQQVSITFPATAITGPGNFYIGFEAQPSGFFGNGNDFYIDDINITRYVPCTGNPSSNITGPSNICAGIPFFLLDSATSGLSGMLYQWQSRLAGTSTFTNITGGPNSAIYNVPTGINVSMDYRVISTCTNSALTDTSAIHTITVNPFYNCYCGPATGSNLGGNPYPELDSVGISATTLHNATYGPLPNYYASYPPTGHTTGNLAIGGTYRVSSLTSAIGQKGAAWIDFDRSGAFQATDYVAMTGSPSSNRLDGVFTVPLNAQTGLTGMRVRASAQNFTNIDWCKNMPSGETEDYVVNIVPALFNDVGAVNIIQPANEDMACANTNLNVRVAIANFGTATQSNFPVFATYYGPNNVSGTIYTNYTGTLPGFGFDTINVGTISLPLPGNYYITANTYLSNDQNHLNDSFTGGLFVITQAPANPVVTNDTVCLGKPATISVQPVPGNVFNWYSAPAGGTSVYQGSSKYFASLMNTTTYFVAAATPGTIGTIPAAPTAPDTAGQHPSPGGTYLDIQPGQNLSIDGFNLRFADTGNQVVKIWYRVSQPAVAPNYPSYYTMGLFASQANWIQVTTTMVHVTNISNHPSSYYHVTLPASIQLTSGPNIIYSIYLDYDAMTGDNSALGGGVNYGPGYGPIAFGGTNTFWYGFDLDSYEFGPVNTSKQYRFNGQVLYHTGGSACESQRIPITAAIGPQPSVHLGAGGPVCWTPNLHLDAGYNPAAIYAWSRDYILEPQYTGQILPIPLSDTGTHTYTVIASRYCNDSDTTTFTILPPPYATGINYTQQGNTYFFSVSGTRDVLTYYWLFGDGTSSVQAAPVHTYNDANPHNIRLVVYNQCSTDTLFWTVPTLRVPNIASNTSAIQLYPNPANTSITISGNDNMEIKDIEIINSVGQVMLRQVSNRIKTDNIDISQLPQGHYILRANTSEGYYNKLFEVLH